MRKSALLFLVLPSVALLAYGCDEQPTETTFSSNDVTPQFARPVRVEYPAVAYSMTPVPDVTYRIAYVMEFELTVPLPSDVVRTTVVLRVDQGTTGGGECRCDYYPGNGDLNCPSATVPSWNVKKDVATMTCTFKVPPFPFIGTGIGITHDYGTPPQTVWSLPVPVGDVGCIGPDCPLV